jgi:demethylmenaquinone methyltransferase/2-methoxy-6-polyprenyl-1,4-benzoquinol methylase
VLRPHSTLELGVGSGKNLSFLSSGFRIGFDVSMEMLKSARKRCPDARFVLGDAHHLPVKDASVDLCVLCYCLRGIAKPLEVVKEALRVASRVIVIDYNRPGFLPRWIWDGVIERIGAMIFGSRNLDFGAIGRLGSKAKVMDFYGSLYRVLIIDGAGDA